jgi:hypothetical protein
MKRPWKNTEQREIGRGSTRLVEREARDVLVLLELGPSIWLAFLVGNEDFGVDQIGHP